MEERANSRLGESVSDLYRAKIRLGEFKAVYCITNINVVIEIIEDVATWSNKFKLTW